LIDLQRTEEERKMLMEISLYILEDVANLEHQFQHRMQLSHCKMSAMKYISHLKSPRQIDGLWLMVISPSSFSQECWY
jgi:2-phosphoglycerate kinase